MANPSDHDHHKLLDLWELFISHPPVSVLQQNLYRDLEIALGLVRCATQGKARQEAINRCLRAWNDRKFAMAFCPCAYHAGQR